MCFFEPTWPFYLTFNLSKTIHFLKRPWFLYVLSKYQVMFKVLQWNAMLWKIPTLKIAVIPQKFPIYRSCIKSSISILKYNQTNQIWAQNNSYTYQFNYSIPSSICHNTTNWKELFSLKGTTFVYVLSSEWLNYWFDT